LAAHDELNVRDDTQINIASGLKSGSSHEDIVRLVPGAWCLHVTYCCVLNLSRVTYGVLRSQREVQAADARNARVG
jgi:hypothetical protein